ncbi:MAG: glutamyl-tRNA reductase, partial [Planctomycetales bacterium]|nr:glutamyl-tRNA reductase [Planctomycetales bacterium]
QFLAQLHAVAEAEIFDELYERTGDDAMRHLFTVASSLDSMVVGEPQILGQVKQAYDLARSMDSAGPLTHSAFQSALRVAKRVATETALNEKRVSIPSVAVLDVARQFFERFDDKHVLVIGAGEMGEETLRYLIDEGATNITVVNRSFARAASLAEQFNGKAAEWESLHDLLTRADLVITTTGATEPIISVSDFHLIAANRHQRTLFILDLAVPRDFDPAIGDEIGVYLYSVDDLQKTCEANQKKREKEWPKARKIVDEETNRLLSDWNRRITAPAIRELRQNADRVKQLELSRLFNKLGDVDDVDRKEIETSFNRLVNKILHPPLESLRDEAEKGAPHGLLDALKRLFQLEE